MREKFKRLMVFGLLLSLIGLILMFSSVNFGTSLAQKWQFERGVVEPWFGTVVEGYTNMFLFSGSIFLGSGLLTLILVYYTVVNSKN
ncbi:hypothetical protein [Aquisalibacillus elongatus]|uniref:hypothetical protein n=1 Tax=Aquisalibacillus elongatus TaxID=485577 RepID=UPI000F52B3C0|nr:hypothetical protein [Aquisalibacillus elongatus]